MNTRTPQLPPIQTLAELLAEPISPPERQHVQIDWETLELVITINFEYRIDLERCRSSAHVLDYILQVAGKTWCTPKILKELVEAFEEATRRVFGSNAQGVFCPSGRNRTCNWTKPSNL